MINLDDIEPDHVFIGVIDSFDMRGWSYEFDTPSSHFFSGEYDGNEALIKLYKKAFFETDFGKRVYEKEKNGLRLSTSLHGFVSCLGEGRVNDVPYFVLSRFEGRNVAELLDERKKLNPNTSLPSLVELVEIVGGLHEKDHVHVDLKPSNFFFTYEGFRVVDVGLVSPVGFFSDNGKALGTPAYMSPEQIRNEPLFPSSDVYSLGLSLYQMLSGVLPSFANGETLPHVVSWHIKETPVLLVKVNPRVPIKLSDVVMKALVKDAEERYRHGKEMADALGACC
tara:strand:- start:280 stop:1122 length:843 start_codon:yes stop_codon:yes gene_type:complete